MAERTLNPAVGDRYTDNGGRTREWTSYGAWVVVDVAGRVDSVQDSLEAHIEDDDAHLSQGDLDTTLLPIAAAATNNANAINLLRGDVDTNIAAIALRVSEAIAQGSAIAALQSSTTSNTSSITANAAAIVTATTLAQSGVDDAAAVSAALTAYQLLANNILGEHAQSIADGALATTALTTRVTTAEADIAALEAAGTLHLPTMDLVYAIDTITQNGVPIHNADDVPITVHTFPEEYMTLRYP